MALQDFYTIGQTLFESWSPGYGDQYLKVLPHPDVTVPYTSAWQEWQKGQADYENGNYTYVDPNGLYYSSWGPDSDTVEIELKLSEFNELYIPGLGKLTANNNENDSSYDDNFLFYNGDTGSSQGPLIVVDPGDTIKVRITNELPEDPASSYYDDTNLHTHGLHVSAAGNSDNVLITIDSGTSWETEIKVPDDHFVGPDWYHPHLHGATNVQVSKGLAGPLLIQPSTEETDDLDNFNPVKDPVYWMSLQTWALNQEERVASSSDPVNQDPNEKPHRIATPAEVVDTDEEGIPTYNVSEAGYVGYNYMPNLYDPKIPAATDGASAWYGFGLNGAPIENIIHTVNGQYNPTIDAKVGEWNLFGFLNFSVNSHHVIQLVREHEGNLSLEEFQLVAVDGDVSGAAEEGLSEQTETPAIAPGARMTLQHAFTKPGKYYFLSNGTNEILGDLASEIVNTESSSSVADETYYGFNDGHLVWGAQVLATVNVTGEEIDEQPAAPEPWNYITNEQAEIDAWMAKTDQKMEQGKIKQREFVWSAMDGTYPMFGADNLNGEAVGAYPPSDNDPADFEGAYRINGRYFGHTPQEQSVVAMPMLGTTEEWTIVNKSYGEEGIWGEWHPFHIHQNDFIVTEINGLSTDEITAYPSNQLADTVLLGGAYINGTQHADNPYGQAAGLTTENVQPFSTKIRMRFEDFPGAYVNHCHILFHEDAGMMQAVKVILNTDSTFLSPDQASGAVNLQIGSNIRHSFQLVPYESAEANTNFNLAIGDINYGKFFGNAALDNDANYESGTKGFSDNITDIVTIQNTTDGEYTIRIFDGDAVKQAATGQYKFAGFAPVAQDDMTKTTINEDALLSELTLESDVYWEKASDNPDDHEGSGGSATWDISTFKGTTYIEDVFSDDGNYVGWNANTDPSQIIGANGETIPSSYPDGSFVFASEDGKDSLITEESHGLDEVASDGAGLESYTIIDGTGRFTGATGEILGEEVYYGGADITLNTNPQSIIQAVPQRTIDGTDDAYILKDIVPFKNINIGRNSETSLAVGDIDGDGHADVIAGIGGANMEPIIEIYSGADYSLMGRIAPFLGKSNTTINLATGDINSDNFVDIIVGQGEGGGGYVHSFDGRSIFEVSQNAQGTKIGDSSVRDIDPMNGQEMHAATEMYVDDFQPFGDYEGNIDVSSGYINPRPEYQQSADELDQVIQSSFANLIAIKTGVDSSKSDPSIKSFYYTGGSGHESHSDGEHSMSMQEMQSETDIPTLEMSLNIKSAIANVNGTFFDLSENVNHRGNGGLRVELENGKEYMYYIETDKIQKGENQVFGSRRTLLSPGEAIDGTSGEDRLKGTPKNDTITGHQDKDTLSGAKGSDVLYGGKGDDNINGGKGSDLIDGGSGANTLTGGQGYDVFMVSKKANNTIIDLNTDEDTILVPNTKYTLTSNYDDTLLTFDKSGGTSLIIGVDPDTLANNNLIQVS